MKKTRKKNIRRGIRSSLNRFLSILFIVALGSGFMAGLFATSPDMYETADRYMDDCALYDLDIKSQLGFSQEDADAVRALSVAEQVQASKVMDMVLADTNRTTYTARVFALLDNKGHTDLNQLNLIQGRFPKDASECVLQNATGQYMSDSPQLGDTITLSEENTNYETLRSSVTNESLTVVGIVESPMCISVEGEATPVGSGSISLDVYVTRDYYAFEYYTDLYLTVSGTRALNTFDDDYEALVDEAITQVEDLGAVRSPLRVEQIKAEAQEQIQTLKRTLAELERLAGLQTMMAQDSVARLGQTAQTIRILGDSPLSSLLQETQSAVQTQLQNEKDPTALLEQARMAIAQAQTEADQLDDGSWFIRTRDDSPGYSGYASNVGKVAALSKVFPVFFFLVALLVALTSMTRLVDENRLQIGTLKALGFSNWQILEEYLLYSLLASVLGCALGFAVGFPLFPKVISSAYGMMYFLPATAAPFRPEIALLVAPITIGSILLATFWACYGAFRACPAQLMVPKAPAAGKRIWLEHITPIWKHLSFTRKVTFRNLFRYKKRLFMTMIGVAGCSALLVTGFGLRDSISDIVEKQFGQIYQYALTIVTTDADAAETDQDLSALLSDSDTISGWMRCASENGKAEADGTSERVSISVPEDIRRLNSFILLRERKTQNEIALGTEGAVLTEKLCERLGVQVGDKVTLENEVGQRGEVSITGITENYIASYAYLSPETYESLFGASPSLTQLLCCVADSADSDTTVARALTSDSVVYAHSSQSIRDTFSDSIKSIDAIVLVLIVSAGLLCGVVLYNLTNVNICERRKELATIRVLGFHKREVEQYIFRETNLLSFLGAVLGLFAGIWLHSFVVRTVEVDQVMFGRSIYPMSFIYALAISVIFTFLVNQIMKRQIRSVDMVEAMKAND